MSDLGERLQEMGFLNVQPDQPCATTTRFQVNIRGTTAELNDDLMERIQLLMTNIGNVVTVDVDKRLQRTEDHVDKRLEQVAEHVGKQVTAFDQRRGTGTPQSSSSRGELPDPMQTVTLPAPQAYVSTEEKLFMRQGIQRLAEITNSLNDERAELVRTKQQLSTEQEWFSSIPVEKEKDQRVIRRLQRKLAHCRTELARLNSIIIERGQPDEVLDEEKLVHDYRNLLRTIDDIARSHYTSPIVRPLIPVAGSSEDEIQERDQAYEQCWAGWDDFSPEERNYPVRSTIFKTLHDECFVYPLFGLSERAEDGLAAFELSLEQNKMIAPREVQEWRWRTVAAALCLSMSNIPSRTVTAGLCEEGLWSLLLPILTWTEDRRKPREECKHAMAVLCESAVRFRLDMRRTRAVYRMVIPEEVDLVDETPGSMMKEISLPPQLTEEPIHIVFAVSGALIRDPMVPSGPGSGVEVLEKARVVGGLPADREARSGS